MPPQKILKNRPSKIKFEGTFNDLLLLLFQDSMHIVKQLMYIWLNSTEYRGSGGMPPRKILKIKPSEIESEDIFNGLLPGLLQDSTLQNN